MGLVACKIWWTGLGIGASYLQVTLLLAGYRHQGSWGRGLGFCPSVEVLEGGMSCQVDGHSPHGSLCILAS